MVKVLRLKNWEQNSVPSSVNVANDQLRDRLVTFAVSQPPRRLHLQTSPDQISYNLLTQLGRRGILSTR